MASAAPNPKWKEKVDITYEEYFNPPWYIPHIGIVQIARELEKEVGREKAFRIISRAVQRLAYDWAKTLTKDISVQALEDIEKGLAPIRSLQTSRSALGAKAVSGLKASGRWGPRT